MIDFIRNHRVGVGVSAVAVLAGVAWLAFGYFGVHTLFVDDVVDEAGPVFDVAAVPADEAAVADDTISTEATAPAEQTGTEATDPAATPTTEPAAPAADAPDSTEPAAPVVTTEAPAPATTAPPTPEIVTEFTGTFSGTSRYDTSGVASVLGNGTGQRFLRFENFETNNGPDLNVYLFNPNDPNDYIDLGDLSGNIGNQNYEIPESVDLSIYSEVSIWCVRFGVGFGSADLTPA